MAVSPSAERASGRLVGWLVGLLLASLVGGVFWPAFRDAMVAGGSAVAVPLLRRAGAKVAPGPRAPSHLIGTPLPSDRLATLARRMEFRVRRYRVTPALMQTWMAEWGCGPAEKLQMLRLLLGQLPEAAAKETPAPQRQDLLQCVLTLSAELRRADPGNGFLWLTESLALLHSGQEAPAMLALGEALRAGRAEAGLRALNASELAIWTQRLDPWTLFPPMPRRWGLDAERPLHNLGRSLSLQQRTFLKKYNLERANELALVQLRLATLVAECGWTPGDLAAARATANRAMLPLWPSRHAPPSNAQLEQNFLSSLEDQGDRLGLVKARAWLGDLGHRESALRTNLPVWRRMQKFSAWTAPSVLACLAAQSALTLGGWILLARSVRVSHEPPHARWAVGVLAFAPAPIIWSVLGWPPGLSLLALGLLGSLVLWFWWASMTPGGLRAARPKLAAAALGNLAALLALSLFVACALQYQRTVLPPLLANGLISAK
jgi:hypothetical protein